MSATDITGPLARIVAILEAVPSIGLVHDHDILSSTDLQPQIQSTVGGSPTLRAWMVRGPSLEQANRAEQREAGYARRRWVYEIRGFTGRSDTSQATLRALALAVCDALDADFDLAGTCHATDPCRWRGQIRDRLLIGQVAVSEIVIDKAVMTLSTPS